MDESKKQQMSIEEYMRLIAQLKEQDKERLLGVITGMLLSYETEKDATK